MKNEKTIFFSYIKGLCLIILGVALDQSSKWIATANLKDANDFIIIKNIFRLHYLENQGAAFGIFQGGKIFFVIGTMIVLIAIIYFYRKIPLEKHFIPLKICILMIASGAIGNFIDRIRLDYVVDFFYFELINFPVFNMADIYVTVSAVVLCFLILFYYKEKDLEFLSFSSKKNPGESNE